MASFEEAAARSRDSLVAALISRHNQRMGRIGRGVSPDVIGRARIMLCQLFALDTGLLLLGADQDRHPVFNGGKWSGELGWGVDSGVASIRLLLCGQLGGAAQIARSQFERWSMNLEHNLQARKRSDESAGSYFDRIWMGHTGSRLFLAADNPRRATRFKELTSARRFVSPGDVYNSTSEFLHGRGTLAEAATWYDASHLLEPLGVDRLAITVSNQVLDLVELCIQRLFDCVATFFEQKGEPERAIAFADSWKVIVPAGSRPVSNFALWPLLPHPALHPEYVHALKAAYDLVNAIQRGEELTGHKYNNEGLAELYFMKTRYRSVRLANHAFEKESELLDKGLDFTEIQARDYRQIITSEVLGLISLWHPRAEVRAAAAAACSGLRSAFWLWLEDDDRAMGVLRNVLMLVARLRVHAQSQEKADKLEARPSTTPRDWLEKAGWRRLQVFNLALGELAHTRAGSRWSGARDLLVALQPEDTDPELAPQMGRGYALDTVVRLAAKVSLQVLGELSPELNMGGADVMSATAIFHADMQELFERWRNRTWDNKDFNLGDPDMKTRNELGEIAWD